MSPGAPWYRQFWPWFLVGLMIVSMTASLATVVIAYGLGNLEIAETVPGSDLEAAAEPTDGRP